MFDRTQNVKQIVQQSSLIEDFLWRDLSSKRNIEYITLLYRIMMHSHETFYDIESFLRHIFGTCLK